MGQEIYKRIGGNSLYNLLGKLYAVPVIFLFPPVILGYIGMEGYGVWVFIQIFVSYGGLLQMGTDSAVIKFTAQYKAEGNYPKIIQIFNTFFVTYLFLFTLFCIAVVISQDWIIDAFMKTKVIPRKDISFALILYATAFGIKNIFIIYPSFLNGIERMDLMNKVEMLSVSCNFIFSIFFLYLGYGIKGLASALAVSTLITTCIYVCTCKKVTPYLRLNPFLFNFGILSEVRKYIFYGAIGNIAAMGHFQFNKLIISYFLGVRYLTYYDLGHKISYSLFGLFGSFFTPLMPAASGIYTSLGVEKLKEVFQTTFKYIALIAIPAFLFTAFMAKEIIFVWVGAGYDEAAFVLRFLSIACLILTFTGPLAMIFTGIGLIDIPFYGGIIAGVSNVMLSLVLVNKFGILGALVSVLLGYILSCIYGFYYYQKRLGGSVLDALRCLLFPLVTSIIVLLIVSFIGYAKNYYIVLFSSGILFSILYIFLAYKRPEYGKIKDFMRHPLFFFTYRG